MGSQIEFATSKNVLSNILIQLNILKSRIEIVDKVVPVLQKYEGKQISKRVQTSVQEVFQGCCVSYNKDFCGFEISIWGEKIGLDYNNRLCLKIGEENQEKFSMEFFNKRNEYYLLSQKKYNDLLEKSSNVDSLVSEYNTMVQSMLDMRKKIDGLELSSYFYIPYIWDGIFCI